MASKSEEILLENLESLKEWASLGISQKEMAAMLGMSFSTFRKARDRNSALSALFRKSADEKKAGKDKQVEKVEMSLFQRCTGYNAKVKKVIKVKKNVLDEEGEPVVIGGKPLTEEVLEEVVEEQHVAADIGAIKFFLMNRARKDWKSDPERLDNERQRVRNDSKRTKLAEQNANGQTGGKSVEDFLDAAEAAAIGLEGAEEDAEV